MDSPKFIIRNQANINFTTVDNYFIKDKDLSTNAKGLLIQLLALPDKWEFSKNGILSQIKEGKKFLEKYMKELQDKGYMEFDKFRNPTTGRFQYEYRIYAIPYFCEFLPDGNIYNPKTNKIGREDAFTLQDNAVIEKEISQKQNTEKFYSLVKEMRFSGTLDELKRYLPDKLQLPNRALAKMIRSLSDKFDESGIVWHLEKTRVGLVFSIGIERYEQKDTDSSSHLSSQEKPGVTIPDTLFGGVVPSQGNMNENNSVTMPDSLLGGVVPSQEKSSVTIPDTLSPDLVNGCLYKRMNNKKIDIRQIEKEIKENVRLSDLLVKHIDPNNQEKIKAMVEIIIDVMSMNQDHIRIGNEMYSTEKVKERLLTITDEHIEYILENLQRITHPIKNIRSYLMKSLYTAPLSKNFSDYSKRRNIEDFPSWYSNTKQTEPDEQLINEVKEIQKRLKIEEQETDPKLESEIQHMLQDIEKRGIRV